MAGISLNKLRDVRARLSRPSHDYRVSLQEFPDLDADRIAANLDLDNIAEKRGLENFPLTTSASYDDTELKITERIQSEHKSAQSQYLGELQAYAQRIAGLEFESKFAELKQAASGIIGDFRAEVGQGRNTLNLLRRRLTEAERERNDFQRKWNLTRAPRPVSSGAYTFKVGILLCILVVESFINGSFLAVSDARGLLGGIFQAFSFALLNIGVCFVIGLVGVRQINTPRFFWRLIGFTSILIFILFALLLNLGLAHYRDLAISSNNASQLVMEHVKSNPLGLKDLQSWVFFGLGMLFSVIAFSDGLLFTDPFWGYGSVEARRQNAHDTYIDTKESLLNNLRDIKDNTSEELRQIQSDLGERREEFDVIIQARRQYVALFAKHESHLQHVGNLLLQRYREINQTKRTTKPPKYFSRPFVLDRFGIDTDLSEDTTRADLRKKITESQDVIQQQSEMMHTAFEDAIRQYHLIDDMLPVEDDLRSPTINNVLGQADAKKAAEKRESQNEA